LIEESRTNNFTNSNDFTTWTKQTDRTGVVGVTTSSIISPDGTTNAYRFFVQTQGGTYYSIFRGFTVAANTYYTFSFFIKAGENSIPSVTLLDGTTNAGFITYNLNTGTVSGSYTYTANITLGNLLVQNYGNGWYRCRIPFTNSLSVTFQIKINVGTILNQGVYLYGAQLEAGAFPTSYIPTTASTVTRSADNASMTGTNFSSWYNQTESTILCNFNAYNLARLCIANERR